MLNYTRLGGGYRQEKTDEMTKKCFFLPDCKYWRELDDYLYWYEVQEKAPVSGAATPGGCS